MPELIPSMASANQLNLKKSIDSLGRIKKIHFDIEDGNFIDNITFGLRTVRDVLNYTDREADAHLMVTTPGRYIDDLMALGVKAIAVHVESGIFPAAHLHRIRRLGGRAGLALNFMAPVSTLLPYLQDIDYALLMTSEPDGRGQVFNPWALGKIAEARRLLPAHISIVVDGGITEDWLPEVVAAGADTVILGRTLWVENPEAQYERLQRMLDGIEEDKYV